MGSSWILPTTRWRVLFFTTVLLTLVSYLIHDHPGISTTHVRNATYNPGAVSQASSQTAANAIGQGLGTGAIPLRKSASDIQLIQVSAERKPSTDTSFDVEIDKPVSNFESGTQLHMVGVYKGDDGVNNPPWWSRCGLDANEMTRDQIRKCHQKYAGIMDKEPVTVNVTASIPVVLVLMAYEPVEWMIKTHKPELIKRIILAGMYAQEIKNLPDNVPVDILTRNTSPTCSTCRVIAGHFLAYKKEGKAYPDALEKIKSLTGLEPSSFQGAEKAGQFTVSDMLATNTGQDFSIELSQQGSKIKDLLEVSNHRVDLPVGVWTVLFHSRKETLHKQSDVIVLYQQDEQTLKSMFAINLTQSKQGKGFPKSNSCGERVGYWSETTTNISKAEQFCVWVEHASTPWEQSAIEYAAELFSELSIAMPKTVINSAMRQATTEFLLTTYYYNNPELAGIVTQPSGWHVSPWHPRKLKQDSAREAYVKTQVDWAKSWFQLYKAAL